MTLIGPRDLFEYCGCPRPFQLYGPVNFGTSRAGGRVRAREKSQGFRGFRGSGRRRRRRRKNVRFGPVSGRSARRPRRNRSAGVAETAVFAWRGSYRSGLGWGSAAWFLAVRFCGRRPAVTGGVFDTPPVSLWIFALPAEWAGHARQIVLDGEIAVPDDRGVTRRAPAG